MKRSLGLLFLVSSSFLTAQNLNLGSLKKLKDELKLPTDKAGLTDVVKNKLAAPAEDYDKESFNYAISFSDNAGVFEAREKYDKHKTILNKALTDTDKLDPLEKAAELNKTGEILYASNKFNAARAVFTDAYLIYVSEDAQDDEPYALLQSNRGLLMHAIGHYSKAMKFTQEALDIREKVHKERAPHGVSLNNKAVLLKDLGEYNEAEVLLNRSADIIKNTKGKDSKDLAIILNNQAMLFHTLGRYKEAETKMLAALEIAKAKMSEKKANYIKLRINLAILYRDMERYDEAESIYLDAISIKKKRLGTLHPDYAHLQRGLASLYMAMGKTEKVADLLEKAANAYKRRFNDQHPAYAATQRELGNFYRVQGKFSQASPLLKEVKSIRSAIYGSNHPQTVDVLEDLALLDWHQGKIPSATQRYKTVIENTLTFIDKYFGPMSDTEKMRYWDKLHPRFYRFYSFATANHEKDPYLAKTMFETNLLIKGLLLSSTNKMKASILSSNDSELKNLYVEWLDKREELAHAYTYSKEELKEEKIDIQALEREVNNLEKQLSSKSNVFQAGYLARNEANINSISSALGTNEALLEIIEFPFYEIPKTEKTAYTYLILKPGKPQPEVVVSMEGVNMDGKFLKYYRNAIQYKTQDKNSYKAYWSKVATPLSGFKTIYVSTDGVYNQLNLNTIPDETGKFLIDKHHFVLLGNARELPQVKKRGSTIKIVSADLFGAPDFGSGLSNDERRGGGISNLPGTKIEVTNISKTLKSTGVSVHTMTGNEATEAHIKESNPTVLHIATHGFFLKDVKKSKEDRLFGIEVSKASESALHRSGLLLTGAQKTMDNKNVDHSSTDNGILTAYEVMNMDLSKTELVILSACETGLGDVKVGEGVYGLQRALQIAGAKSIIMSLWKVSDEATALLMQSFYKNLVTYQDKQKAFRLAQQDLKSSQPEAYYWGAFVLIGQ